MLFRSHLRARGHVPDLADYRMTDHTCGDHAPSYAPTSGALSVSGQRRGTCHLGKTGTGLRFQSLGEGESRPQLRGSSWEEDMDLMVENPVVVSGTGEETTLD